MKRRENKNRDALSVTAQSITGHASLFLEREHRMEQIKVCTQDIVSSLYLRIF